MLSECPHCQHLVWFNPEETDRGKTCPGCGKPVHPRPTLGAPATVTATTQPLRTPPPTDNRRRQRIALSVVALLLLVALLLWLLRHLVGGAGQGDGTEIALSSGPAGHPGNTNASGAGPDPRSGAPTNTPPSPPTPAAPAQSDAALNSPNSPAPAVSTGKVVAARTVTPPRSMAPPPVAGPAGGGSGVFTGGRGTRFLFVLDRSGSMANDGNFGPMLVELRKKLQSLSQQHWFSVILFSEDALPMPPPAYLPAAPMNIERVMQWISDQGCDGGTEPTPAMRIALRMDPHTIWLLSDGEFQLSAVEEIAQANRSSRIPINTIAFHASKGNTLQAIAAASGGTFTLVPRPAGGFGPRSRLPGGPYPNPTPPSPRFRPQPPP